MEDSFSLADKVALVIGGSNGLGREIALGFQRAGATTAIIGRTPERIAETTAALGAIGGEANHFEHPIAKVNRVAIGQ